MGGCRQSPDSQGRERGACSRDATSARGSGRVGEGVTGVAIEVWVSTCAARIPKRIRDDSAGSPQPTRLADQREAQRSIPRAR